MRFLAVILTVLTISSANSFVLRAVPIIDGKFFEVSSSSYWSYVSILTDGIQDFVLARSHGGGFDNGNPSNVYVIGGGGGGGGQSWRPQYHRPIKVNVNVNRYKPYGHHGHHDHYDHDHYHDHGHHHSSHSGHHYGHGIYPGLIPFPSYNYDGNDDGNEDVNVQNTNVNNITVTTGKSSFFTREELEFKTYPFLPHFTIQLWTTTPVPEVCSSTNLITNSSIWRNSRTIISPVNCTR